MFWDDILLVSEQIEKYGLRRPMADLGGMKRPCIADYDLTRTSGVQDERYINLQQRPFDHIDPEYLILNPTYGDPYIEDLPYHYREAFGTLLCLNVLEHVKNPFRVFAAFYQLLKQGGLLIVETVFMFPYHPSPGDYWRFTPDGLKLLAEQAGFQVLECDWRLHVPVEWGVRDIHTDELQQIRSVYATLSKGDIQQQPCGPFVLPQRFRADGTLC